MEEEQERITAHYSVLQRVAACCSVLQCVAEHCREGAAYHVGMTAQTGGVEDHCVAVCCSVLQCVAVCCITLQCVAMCCSGLFTGHSQKCTHVISPSPALHRAQVFLKCASQLVCAAVCFNVLQCVDECNYHHFWRNNIVIALGTLSSFCSFT